jgi:hypothetical protein
MQQTNIDTIDRESDRVDIQKTSIGGIRWKVAVSTLFGRVKSIASSIVAKNNDERLAMRSAGGNEEWRHREPRHKYWMKHNVQWKDEQLGEEGVPET